MKRSETKLTLRELNFAKTRFNVLQTFLELILQKDYETVTVEEICEKAEISRGTFFNYFPTKEHIYTFYGWWFCAKLYIELNTEKHKTCSCYDKIKLVFEFTIKEDEQFNNQMPLFISHILRRDKNIIKDVEYTKADFLYQFPNYEDLIKNSSKLEMPTVAENFIILLKEGIEANEFKSDTDIKKVIFQLLSIYFSPYIINKFLRHDYSLKEVYNTLLDDIIEPILIRN
ncbi:TetR/AcrR family transcriptional regulator [Sedimentibacter sp. MB31-C6]|uniref:TetR/AcrR family transcriptional regulator n=1 Tax=Sedimentibacter sp. MB31-C6 TaxID=3109366 RepID=UPI002DDD2451|nr:TetR/AcrR family transcriptional regulator [Sedimentibacter sp. MB36-C1]WSI03186.1 TetR/AcrR family transcriptional regulator [Sedimentibacter sp. MB36-C1]